MFQEESFLKMKRLSKMDGAEIAVKGMGIRPNYQRNLEIREEEKEVKVQKVAPPDLQA